MQLFVRCQLEHTVDVKENATVAEIKDFIAGAEGLLQSDLVVYCGGKPLTDSDALSQFGVASTLDITVRLVGGKVHGSLARAGKVKGQTPKVAKAEDKSKKKTGRAKRRVQYNRRFVAAVTTVGKNKGPNSNSA